MKFVTQSQFTDPDAAARKLVEIANAVEAVQDGRIFIELINGAFLEAGGTPDQYRAALARAIALGCPLSPAALTNAGTSTMATCTSARSRV